VGKGRGLLATSSDSLDLGCSLCEIELKSITESAVGLSASTLDIAAEVEESSAVEIPPFSLIYANGFPPSTVVMVTSCSSGCKFSCPEPLPVLRSTGAVAD
jgi:hypothetical protein